MTNPFTHMRQRIAQWLLASASNTITTSRELDYWLRFGGRETAAGVPVTAENAAALAAMAVCLRVLSDDVSQLPLNLLKRTGDRLEPDRTKPLYRVLHQQPNHWQTTAQFRNLMMRDLLLRGNAYALKTKRGKEVIELLRLHPDAITPKQHERSMAVSYEYTKPDGTTGVYAQHQIMHLWKFSDDGLTGLNPIEMYRETIGDGLAFRQSGSRFFANAARLSGVLELAQGTKVGPESAKALLADFNEMYRGNQAAHSTAILPGGVSFKPVSVNMHDAQYLEIRKKTDRDVYGIFGVPPHKGGDLDQAAVRANVESENISYVVGSLMPWLVCWEQCMLRDLIDPSEQDQYVVKHNVSGLLRGDATTRAAFYRTMYDIRAINPNEIREKEDMNPYEGGEEFSQTSVSPAPPTIQPKEPQQGNG